MQAVKLCTNKTELKNTLNAPVTCALLITIRLSVQFIWWLEWDWISIMYGTTAGVMGTSCRYQLHYKPQNYCLLSTNTANLDKLSKRSCKNKENLLIEILHKRGPAPRRERYRQCCICARLPQCLTVPVCDRLHFANEDLVNNCTKKVKVAHTRLPSVGFRSRSRFLAVSLLVTWIINLNVGCHYFPPGVQLSTQRLKGTLPISLLGEQRHNGCEQFA